MIGALDAVKMTAYSRASIIRGQPIASAGRVGGMKWGALMLAVVSLCLGCSTASGRVTALYGGPAAMRALLQPDKVESYRITSAFRIKPGTVTTGKLHAWPVLAGPTPVPADSARRLADLLRKDIYEWSSAKGCEIIPGVAVRFSRSGTELDVVFCFECDILVVYLNGRAVGSEDFDRAHQDLAAIVRALYPDDAEIQKLK